ncbi:MAG: VCBS repeat-containing protein [Planctomycetes bacterium]|nr:VCBS repeat-containing protein [Planctomycetota bacterium]
MTIVFAIALAVSAPLPFSVQPLHVAGTVKTIVPRDYNGDPLIDLLVSSVATDGPRPVRSLSIFFQSAIGFRRDPDVVLTAPDDAVAFVVGRFDGKGSSAIAWLLAGGPCIAFRDGTRLEKPLPLAPGADVSSLFSFPDEEDLPFLDAVVDLDNDGRDDLLLPCISGTFALYQKADGTFERAGPFGPAPRRTFDDDSLRFLSMDASLPLCRAVDFDGDGRKDLLFADVPTRNLTAYLQGKDGRFPAAPTFQRTLPFLSEAQPRDDEIENVVATLVDIDRNGRIDLVVSRQRGTLSLFTSLQTQELIYFDGPGLFARVPSQVLNVKGVSITPRFEDFDGDGYADLLVSSVRTDVLATLQKAVFKELQITYFVFAYHPGDRKFSANPDYEKDLSIPVATVEKDESTPLAYFQGDFDGDGRRDLMAVNEKGGISIYRGVVKKTLFWETGFGFEDEPMASFDVPASNRFNLGDFNHDGRSDVVFWKDDVITLILSTKDTR